MGCCQTCTRGQVDAGTAEILAALYPTRRWGEPDDGLRMGAGVGEAEARALVPGLSRALAAPVRHQPGRADEPCEWLHVLCVGREPSLLSLRDLDHIDPGTLDLPAATASERHLRVALSAMARVATVQEVVVDVAVEPDVVLVHERPRAGVEDPVLKSRLARLVTFLEEAGIRLLDYGSLARAPAGFDPGDYPARYGTEPVAMSYLFSPEPPTAVITSVIPCADSSS